MFGEGYRRIEGAKTLPAGHYTAKITSCQIVKSNFGEQVECTVEIEGKPNTLPNRFWIQDSPKQGNGKYTREQLMEFWCRSTTLFFDSFHISDFNLATWQGRSGTVTVRPQKNKPQFMEIVPYETNFQAPKQTAPAQNQPYQPQSRQYPQVQQQQWQNQAQPNYQYQPNPQYQGQDTAAGFNPEGFPDEPDF